MGGKIVLITGASSGIGAGTAQHFASWQCRLALVGRNTEALNEIAKCCLESKAHSVHVMGNKDLSKPEVCRAVIEETVQHFGGKGFRIFRKNVRLSKNNLIFRSGCHGEFGRNFG